MTPSRRRGSAAGSEANCRLTTIVVVAGLSVRHPAAHDESRPVGRPLHLQPFPWYQVSAADRRHGSGSSLPSGSAVSVAQPARVCDAIDAVLDSR